MEFYEVLDRRRSVRKFEDKEIEKEKLDRILDAIVSCPTAGNLQAYRVKVVTDEKMKAALAEAAGGQRFVSECPVLLVFSAYPGAAVNRYGRRGQELYAVQDATIATTFAHLAAVSEGLGSCWVGAFDTEGVIKAVGLQDGLVPVAMLPIGYPKKVPSKTSRRPREELISLEGHHPKR